MARKCRFISFGGPIDAMLERFDWSKMNGMNARWIALTTNQPVASVENVIGPRRTCRKAPAGLFCTGCLVNSQPDLEPTVKRAVVFIDGQNLYHCLRETFGYGHPNYDVMKLAHETCKLRGWNVSEARFYTGFPDARDDAQWNQFWTKKLLAIKRQGVHVYSRALRYRDRVIKLSGGATLTTRVGEEKGIDVRLSIDIIRLAHRNAYDVALVFSQDQDLSEVADEVRVIAREQHRWIKMACAFPYAPGCQNERGINGTDWIRLDRTTYERCIDPFDYRAGTRPKAII